MSGTEPAVVRLRTGAEVVASVITTTTIALECLMETNPVAVIEAYELARDPGHAPFGVTGAALDEIGLTQGGVMDGTTRHIILASVEASGWDICFVSPYASDPAPEASA